MGRHHDLIPGGEITVSEMFCCFRFFSVTSSQVVHEGYIFTHLTKLLVGTPNRRNSAIDSPGTNLDRYTYAKLK